MKKLGHSLSDWDYRVGADLGLYTAYYVSPPTALKTTAIPGACRHENLYLKATIAPCVPDGRMIQGFLTFNIGFGVHHLFFRCQDIPFMAIPQNCYWLYWVFDVAQLYKQVAGAPTLLKTHNWDPQLTTRTWDFVRLTFWQYITTGMDNVLRVRLDRWLGGEWVEQFTFDHAENLWADEAVNRIGFSMWVCTHPNYNWVDNTEIWRKT